MSSLFGWLGKNDLKALLIILVVAVGLGVGAAVAFTVLRHPETYLTGQFDVRRWEEAILSILVLAVGVGIGKATK